MSYIGATGYTQYEERFQDIEGNISNISNDLYVGNYSITSNLNRVIRTSSNIFSNLYIGDDCITSNIIKLQTREGITYDDLYVGDSSFASNIKYLKNEVQNETQSVPTKTAIYRIKDLETRFELINNGYSGGNLIDAETGALLGNTISNAFSSIGANIANIGNTGAIWYFLGQCAIAAQVGQTRAATANTKADKSLGIWDEDGNNTYNKKAGNVGIGTTFGSVLNNKLEVNGNINIPIGSTFRINNVNFGYSNLDHKLLAGTNINIDNDYKINSIYTYTLPTAGVGAGGALGGVRVDGSTITITNGVISGANTYILPTAGVGAGGALGGVKVDGSTITITNGVISGANTYTLPTAGVGINGTLGGVKVDGSTITITNGVISGANTYTLPTAGVGSGGTLGGVKVDGSTITITNGVISASATSYTLPTATTDILGGVKIDGTSIVNVNGKIAAVQPQSDWNATNTLSPAFILNKPAIISSQWTTSGTQIYYNGGNVGIGTNNPANAILHLHKTGTTADVRIQITDGASTGAAGRGLHLIKSGTAGYLYNYEDGPLLLGTGGTDRMSIDNLGGNVGIGTNNPIGRLHLHRENATFSQSVNLHFTDTLTGRTATDGFVIGKSSDNSASLYNNENTPMVFATNGGEKMRILANGNVGIGISPAYKLEVNGNIYAGNNSFLLSTYSGTGARQFFGKEYNGEMIAGMEIENTTLGGNWSQKLHFTTHTYGNSYGRRMTIAENGGVSMSGGLSVASGITCTNGQVIARNGYDTLLHADTGMMAICMGNAGTGTNATYFRIGAYSSMTYYESSQNRNHRFYIYNGTLTGNSRLWEFNQNSGAYNALNSTTWTQASDQRIKENIVRADLNKCYDNVKNINLYRFNYIDSFQTSKQDKNKLGYIAQEVKRYFPKATLKSKTRLNDKREIPDLLTIDIEQINLSLYGAVKQLIKIVEKQNKRIKALETLLGVSAIASPSDEEIENDAGEAYERIYDEEEVDIDTIEPTEPEQDRAPMGVSPPSDDGGESEPSVPTEPSTEEEIEEINVD